MIIKQLQVTVYEADGWKWRSNDICDPTWDEIEDSIRNLDRFRHPFVWLMLGHERNEGQLDIVGGDGAFALSGYTKKQGDKRYYNVEHSSTKEISIWTSDQGCEMEELYVCYDIDVVLRAAKYFCDHGSFDPELPWD